MQKKQKEHVVYCQSTEYVQLLKLFSLNELQCKYSTVVIMFIISRKTADYLHTFPGLH